MDEGDLPAADAVWLRAKAAQCYRLAAGIATRPDVADQLRKYGATCEAKARAFDNCFGPRADAWERHVGAADRMIRSGGSSGDLQPQAP